MSVRKVVLIVVAVNLAFVAAIAGLYWSQSVRAKTGGQLQGAAIEGGIPGKVPEYLSYQGVVKDSGGNPLEGSHDLTFTLYSCYGGPFPSCTAVWSGTYTPDLVDGLFNARLGPVDRGLFEPGLMVVGWHLEVGVKVDGGTELTPRVWLNTTVPWAFTSMYTESMPEPDYDSDWIDSPGGPLCGGYQPEHNLGGNLDNYVVVLECRRGDVWGTYNCVRPGGPDAIWYGLTTTDIRVNPCATTQDALEFRLRIWLTR